MTLKIDIDILNEKLKNIFAKTTKRFSLHNAVSVHEILTYSLMVL
jgi:hypothetical protein